ncbi:MAG TPA: hypothetical protein VIL44_10325 [Micromonospora sp.]
MTQNVAETFRKVSATTNDISSLSATMTGTIAGSPITARMVINTGTPARVEMTITQNGAEQIIRIIGDVAYVQAPGSRGGKSWIKMDMSSVNESNPFAQYESLDPRSQVRMLLDKSKDVTVVGQEEVDGVPTVHYSVVVSPSDFLSNTDEKQRAALERELTAQGLNEITIHLWVDEEYRPRKSQTVIGKDEITVTYSDYGTAPEVAEPPASEVTDLKDAFKLD